MKLQNRYLKDDTHATPKDYRSISNIIKVRTPGAPSTVKRPKKVPIDVLGNNSPTYIEFLRVHLKKENKNRLRYVFYCVTDSRWQRTHTEPGRSPERQRVGLVNQLG